MKILRQVVKYGKAYAVWLREGKPIRSEALVRHIFNQHCKPCVHYDPDLKECSICECPVSENSHERNKIVFATEQCPLKPPRWLAEDVTPDASGGSGEGMDSGSENAERAQRPDQTDP